MRKYTLVQKLMEYFRDNNIKDVELITDSNIYFLEPHGNTCLILDSENLDQIPNLRIENFIQNYMMFSHDSRGDYVTFSSTFSEFAGELTFALIDNGTQDPQIEYFDIVDLSRYPDYATNIVITELELEVKGDE